MQNAQQTKAATSNVTPAANTPANAANNAPRVHSVPAGTVALTTVTPLRAARIAAVQRTLYAQYKAAKAAKAKQAAIAAAQRAYAAQLATLQAQHTQAMQALGIAVPQPITAHNAAQRAPSMGGTGVTHVVRQIAAQNGYVRAAVLQACALAGINPATAATQFAIAKKHYVQTGTHLA